MNAFFSKYIGQQVELPNSRAICIAMVFFVLAYIVFSLLMHPSNRTLDYHFYSERGLITGLSAVFLAMAAAFALATQLVLVSARERFSWTWIILAAGFVFLAIDESAQFHERVGDLLDGKMSSGVFRNWNDVVVIVYGLVAIPVFAVIFPGIAKYRMTLKLFCLAFVFYLAHTLIDSIQEIATTTSIIFEESAKLYCGALLALSMFFSFFETLWTQRMVDQDRVH